mgnify:CR=1 FL=1
MGRNKLLAKNQVMSVSLPTYQKQFIQEHPDFDFSKFSQIHLSDYINLFYELERIKKGGL